MAVPEIIPIDHEPGCRTSAIGRFSGGQFLAPVTYAFPDGFARGDGREEQKPLFVVLHTFDHRGRHQESDVCCAGTWAREGSVVARAEARLAGVLAGLAEREYCDIAIQPFRLTVDGVVFGLVMECHAEDEDGEHDRAELHPDQLGFSAPWNGEYDT